MHTQSPRTLILSAIALGLSAVALPAQGGSTAPRNNAPENVTAEVTGRAIVNAQGEELGRAHRVVGAENNRFIILRSGNNQEHAIPYNRFQISNERVILDSDATRLSAAPRFREADEATLSTEEGTREIRQYWEAKSTPGSRDTNRQNNAGNAADPGVNSNPGTGGAPHNANPSTGSRQSSGTQTSGSDNN
jgi:hypothetical protein